MTAVRVHYNFIENFMPVRKKSFPVQKFVLSFQNNRLQTTLTLSGKMAMATNIKNIRNNNGSTPNISSERLEVYINDILKSELRELETHINKYNDEIMEFVQLKNTVQTMRDTLNDGFKTQMHIGGNMFLEANVKEPKMILVDIGASCFLELDLEEAIRFAELRIKVLTKECDVVREESIKKRTEIKLALLAVNETERVADLPERD